MEIAASGAAAPESATAVVGNLTLLVPLAGLIDAAAEVERLGKRLDKVRNDLERARGKLANESFVRNAPAAVVATERARVAQIERTVRELETQLERVRRLL